MIDFFLLLLIVAVFQIFGSVLSLFFVKKFCKNIKIIIVIEILFMFFVSVMLLVEGFNITSLVILSTFVGIFVLAILNKTVPHKHQTKTERIGLLVFIAMCLHEFPEGLAFGSSYLINPSLGMMTASMIALHNIPEGSIVSIPCFMKKRFKVGFKLVLITQLLYVMGGMIAYYFLINVPEYIQAMVMTFAAGAMFYIIFEEFLWMKKFKK
jgi:ZIP family zinc transporter